MRSLFSILLARTILLITFFAVIAFHLLIIGGVIPYNVVWGGLLRSEGEMLQFEAISIFVNLLFLLVVAVHAEIIKIRLHPLVLRIALWVMCILFFLNTIGNLLSANKFEQLVFTPVTLVLALCCLRLVLAKRSSSSSAPLRQ